MADHLSDRVLIEIDKRGSNKPAMFLAYPSTSLSGAASTGPITYSKGLKNKPTLRGYAFRGGSTFEFIYPKKDAVTLAKENNVQVVAVDPASENLPSLPQLTPKDQQEVTLWMLTPTPVQPGDSKPGIAAAKYQPAATASNQTTERAQTSAPSGTPSADAPYSRGVSTHHARQATNGPALVASNEPPRMHAKNLPHTASDLPLVWLAGGLSLLLALTLRLGSVWSRTLRNHA